MNLERSCLIASVAEDAGGTGESQGHLAECLQGPWGASGSVEEIIRQEGTQERPETQKGMFQTEGWCQQHRWPLRNREGEGSEGSWWWPWRPPFHWYAGGTGQTAAGQAGAEKGGSWQWAARSSLGRSTSELSCSPAQTRAQEAQMCSFLKAHRTHFNFTKTGISNCFH